MENVRNIIKLNFEQHSVITQAQILHGLIKHKRLKDPQTYWVLKMLKGKWNMTTEHKTSQKCYLHLENQVNMVSELLIGKLQLLLWYNKLKKLNSGNNVKIAPCFKKNITQIY